MLAWSHLLGFLCTVATTQVGTAFLLASGPQCYQCDGTVSPDECSSNGPCLADQECYTERYLTLDGTETYRLGCISKDVCRNPVQSGNDSHCFSCCLGNHCNRDLCRKDICEPPYYGPFCADICGHCVNGEQCDKNTGQCENGCVRGFHPPLCQTVAQTCPDSHYGLFCTEVCGHCANGEQCNKTDGKCPSGCTDGFLPPYCHATQGPRCHKCSAAFNPRSCPDTEQCVIGQKCYTEKYLLSGTIDAYHLGCASEHICRIASKPANESHCYSCCTDDLCNKDLCVRDVCPQAYYGPYCTDVCGHCIDGEQCDKVTGRCENGCAVGYLPPFCHSLPCPKPFYGPSCIDVCGHCVNGDQCEKTTGRCSSGCEDGFLPPFCQSGCPELWYGPECSHLCGHCAGGQSCDPQNGICINGCEPGFHAPFCTEFDGLLGKDCSDTKQRTGSNTNGVYLINKGDHTLSVWCDMETDNEEWIVFQRRITDSVDFNRNWSEYKSGFGSISANFWWGNDNLAAFTSNRSRRYVLRIDMEESTGRRTYAEYKDFYVDNEQAMYRLHLGTFVGNATNQMSAHNGLRFSTSDRDIDGSGVNCAALYSSGWWFDKCYQANLNGQYLTAGSRSGAGIAWHADSTSDYTLKWTEMKFRPM